MVRWLPFRLFLCGRFHDPVNGHGEEEEECFIDPLDRMPTLRGGGGAGRETVLLIFQPSNFIVYYI